MSNNSLNLEWGSLPFGYMKTDYNVRCYYRDGKWRELEISSSEHLNVHIAATALHYGQQSFEGMKAFTGKDGKIRIFRWEDNAKRMQASARGILMQEVPSDIYKKAIIKAVKLNERFMPPHGSGASMYIRPLLFGSGAEVGVKPAGEYMFVVFVTPVGPYFKTGFKPVDMLMVKKFDRAAPLGTGHIKVGGNYASSLEAIKLAHDKGFANVLYLDSKEKKYIDECGPANFFGIKNNTYITPLSDSILPSITNKSLVKLAEHLGMKTERRKVEYQELDTFEEVGACGTAAVITPIGKIVDNETEKVYSYCTDGKVGEKTKMLYDNLLAIQCGDKEDVFGWVEII